MLIIRKLLVAIFCVLLASFSFAVAEDVDFIIDAPAQVVLGVPFEVGITLNIEEGKEIKNAGFTLDSGEITFNSATGLELFGDGAIIISYSLPSGSWKYAESSTATEVSGNNNQLVTIPATATSLGDLTLTLSDISAKKGFIPRTVSSQPLTITVKEENPTCGNEACQVGIGENCNTCPLDCGCLGGESCIDSVCVLDDTDGDGVNDDVDNCPDIENSNQLDTDDDTFGDVCDNCPDAMNIGQLDDDADGVGDLCENDLEVLDVCEYGVSPLCGFGLSCQVNNDDQGTKCRYQFGNQVCTAGVECVGNAICAEKNAGEGLKCWGREGNICTYFENICFNGYSCEFMDEGSGATKHCILTIGPNQDDLIATLTTQIANILKSPGNNLQKTAAIAKALRNYYAALGN